MSQVVVVGAGTAGLIAARELTAAGASVIVVDKGRGVGGRLATRRLGDATFDHGAQFLTAREPGFVAEVGDWVAAGAATAWFEEPSGHVRYRGVPGMTGIAKHLAGGLDVRTARRVRRVAVAGGRWTVEFDDADRPPLVADGLVVTAPAPQALDLFADRTLTDADRERLRSIAYDPCIAVMLALDRASASPGVLRPAEGPVAWVADNAAKGVSGVPALTAHLGPAASRDHWDDADDDLVRLVTGALDLGGAAVTGSSVQRWRYSLTSAALAEPCLVLGGGVPPGVVAGDGFAGGGRVEAAAVSGREAGRTLAAALGLDGTD